MAVSRKTTQAVTLLLMFLMSTILVIHPVTDLELCFGKNGHVDFSLNNCQNDAAPVRASKDRSHLYTPADHDDCQHVVVGCTTMREVLPPDGKSGIHNTATEKDLPGTTFLSSALLAASAGAFPAPDTYPVFPEDVSSLHLVLLRTVVLLI